MGRPPLIGGMITSARIGRTAMGAGASGIKKQTAPVGSFAANPFGLYDVLHNVWEWVQDCWHESYKGAPTDGSAWTRGSDCSQRVIRGGSWRSVPTGVRSASRFVIVPDTWFDCIGFRLARDLE